MGLFSKKEKPIQSFFKDVEKNTALKLELLEDKLQIGIPGAKPEQLKTLRYEQIRDIAYTSDVTTISKSKSPIGRAIAGGLLFGGVGAVVGAVSGTGTKEKKQYKFYLIINYVSKDGEDKYLQYEDLSIGTGTKFYKALKERANFIAPEGFNEL